jgi:hypothetical protein
LLGGGPFPNAFELARIAFTEPWGEKWQVLALELLGKGEKALAGLSAAASCSAPTRPAISSLVVDQVVDGELRACGYFTSRHDFDSLCTKPKEGVRIAGMVEVALWGRNKIEMTVDEGAVLGAFIEFGTKR